MKLTGFGAIACAALLAVACGGDARDNESVLDGREAENRTGTDRLPGAANDEYQTRTGETIGTSGATSDDRQFVERAAMGGHAEVELGRLAAERAQSQEVKQFAEMMVREHSKANDELKQAASRANVAVPAAKLDEKHQELMTKLRGLQGAEFDREYMAAMVEGHEEMKDLLDDRAGDRSAAPGERATGTSGTTAASVDQWAAKTLPSVEQHLQRAEQIQAKLR